jgi:hypothetical protein
MARLEHAVAAVVLLVAFVTDLRWIVPAVGVLLVVHAWMTRSSVRMIEAGLLAVASLAFGLGNEFLGWGIALAAAVLCGVAVAKPDAVSAAS